MTGVDVTEPYRLHVAWALARRLSDHGGVPRKETGKTQAQNYGRSMDGSNSFGVVGCDKTRAVLSAKVKLQPDRSVGKYSDTRNL